MFCFVSASYAGEDKETLCDSLVRNTIAVYNTVITQVITLQLHLQLIRVTYNLISKVVKSNVMHVKFCRNVLSLN